MKLHLGCGKRKLSGWIHVDWANHPHIDYPNHDIARLPMFEDMSATEIYAAHVFEYFGKEEALDALREWRRVLVPGGTLRLSVPDFEMLARIYLRRRNIALVLGPVYGKIDVDSVTLWHQTAYDEASLSTLLLVAGFYHIHRWDWRDFFPSDYDDCSAAYIPHMDFENGTLISLNLAAHRR